MKLNLRDLGNLAILDLDAPAHAAYAQIKNATSYDGEYNPDGSLVVHGTGGGNASIMRHGATVVVADTGAPVPPTRVQQPAYPSVPLHTAKEHLRAVVEPQLGERLRLVPLAASSMGEQRRAGC